MKKISLSIFVVLFVSGMALFSFKESSQTPPESVGHVNWLTDFVALEQMMKDNPKPILYDIQTSWCGPCQKMKKEVFSKEKVYSYINEHFYAVLIDAERKDDVVFRGQTFKWFPTKRGGGYNPIADFVTDNQTPGYPTIAIMNKEYKVKYVETGYHNTRDLMYALEKFNK